jgi:hypothetical protein
MPTAHARWLGCFRVNEGKKSGDQAAVARILATLQDPGFCADQDLNMASRAVTSTFRGFHLFLQEFLRFPHFVSSSNQLRRMQA